MRAIDYAGVFVSFMLGVVTGLYTTLRLMKKNSGPPEGDMPENWWECSQCGFTTSCEPMGKCPVCKFNGNPVP